MKKKYFLFVGLFMAVIVYPIKSLSSVSLGGVYFSETVTMGGYKVQKISFVKLRDGRIQLFDFLENLTEEDILDIEFDLPSATGVGYYMQAGSYGYIPVGKRLYFKRIGKSLNFYVSENRKSFNVNKTVPFEGFFIWKHNTKGETFDNESIATLHFYLVKNN